MVHEVVHLLIQALNHVIFWTFIGVKLMLQLGELDIFVEVPGENYKDFLNVVFGNDLECVLNACLPQFANFNSLFEIYSGFNEWVIGFHIIVEERFVNFAVFEKAAALNQNIIVINGGLHNMLASDFQVIELFLPFFSHLVIIE